MQSLRRPVAVLCLVACGAALGSVFRAEGQAIRESPPIRLVDLNAAASLPSPYVGTPSGLAAARRGAPRDVRSLGGTHAFAAPSPGEAAEHGSVRVPNLVGLRLTNAERRASRRGLRLAVRDEDGNPVDLADSARYRVVGQSIRRASSIEPERVLELRVRDRAAS